MRLSIHQPVVTRGSERRNGYRNDDDDDDHDDDDDDDVASDDESRVHVARQLRDQSSASYHQGMHIVEHNDPALELCMRLDANFANDCAEATCVNRARLHALAERFIGTSSEVAALAQALVAQRRLANEAERARHVAESQRSLIAVQLESYRAALHFIAESAEAGRSPESLAAVAQAVLVPAGKAAASSEAGASRADASGASNATTLTPPMFSVASDGSLSMPPAHVLGATAPPAANVNAQHALHVLRLLDERVSSNSSMQTDAAPVQEEAASVANTAAIQPKMSAEPKESAAADAMSEHINAHGAVAAPQTLAADTSAPQHDAESSQAHVESSQAPLESTQAPVADEVDSFFAN